MEALKNKTLKSIVQEENYVKTTLTHFEEVAFDLKIRKNQNWRKKIILTSKLLETFEKRTENLEKSDKNWL